MGIFEGRGHMATHRGGSPPSAVLSLFPGNTGRRWRACKLTCAMIRAPGRGRTPCGGRRLFFWGPALVTKPGSPHGRAACTQARALVSREVAVPVSGDASNEGCNATSSTALHIVRVHVHAIVSSILHVIDSDGCD